MDYLKVQVYWRMHARETVLHVIRETLGKEEVSHASFIYSKMDRVPFNEVKGLAWRMAAKLSKWEIIDSTEVQSLAPFVARDLENEDTQAYVLKFVSSLMKMKDKQISLTDKYDLLSMILKGQEQFTPT